MICFNEQSVIVNEDQGSIMFSITTNNYSSSNALIFTIIIIATDGTAIGKLKVWYVVSYIAKFIYIGMQFNYIRRFSFQSQLIKICLNTIATYVAMYIHRLLAILHSFS